MFEIPTLSSAINLVAKLQKINKKIKDAELNNLLADLSLDMANTKSKMAKIINENTELKNENTQMKEKNRLLTSASGDHCPKCKKNSFELVSTRPHSIFGKIGGKERDYKCSLCGFAESKVISP